MKKTLRTLIMLGTCAAMPVRTEAVPLLQLDIVGGHYDAATETIVASGEHFTLVALLTPKPNTRGSELSALLAGTFYISAAVVPASGTAAPGGSFSFAGSTYSVTSDLLYGTPPLDADQAHDGGDLAAHGVFPAYFRQFGFQFTPTQRATTYDAAHTPGGLIPAAAGSSYYATFAVATSLLGAAQSLHFDLYNTTAGQCPGSNGRGRGAAPCTDIDIGVFAPPSHDAESGHTPIIPDMPDSNVPEPASLLMVGLGAVGAARFIRRRK